MTLPTAHSPLGGSGAERFLLCPGSVGLSQGLDDDHDDTFSAPGQAAHSVGEICLNENVEAWTLIGDYWFFKEGEYVQGPLDEPPPEAALGTALQIDKEIVDAVQVYLDDIERVHPDWDILSNQQFYYIEKDFHCPQLNPYMYGRSDFGFGDFAARHLHVWEYKHGAGIVVEAPENAQLMYYACGVLESMGLWNEFERVTLHVSQPRGWHWMGPHRRWTTTVAHLREWLYETLLPGMERALTSDETKSGDHCRFCPAVGHACPQILDDFRRAKQIMDEITKLKGVAKLNNEKLGELMTLLLTLKKAEKSYRTQAFKRISHGGTVPGWQIGDAKVNREWKEGAQKELVAEYGADAWEPRKLKSPAQVEQMLGGDVLAQRWAYKPKAGQTVMPASDSRPAITRDKKSHFKPQPAAKKTGSRQSK